MKHYRDPDHNSGIVGYDLEHDGIWVYFADRWRYHYSTRKLTAAQIAEMHRLADVVGNGLNRFININPSVRSGWDSKERY